jgi:hypothetical protein
LYGPKPTDDLLKQIWAKPNPRYSGNIKEITDEQLPKTSLKRKKVDATLTAHHPFKRSVFGENNHVKYLSQRDHRRVERLIIKGEVWALRDNIQTLRRGIEKVITRLRGSKASPSAIRRFANRGGETKLLVCGNI